jgi:hypothetical protein
MLISSTLTEQIEARIKEFLAETTPDPNGMRKIAAEFRVLPLFPDFGACYAIRPNGEVISVGWDDHSDVQVHHELRTLRTILFQGSKRYPELQTLLPPKPVDARVCHVCNGTGIFVIAGTATTTIVCHCGGYGWLPPDSSTDEA